MGKAIQIFSILLGVFHHVQKAEDDLGVGNGASKKAQVIGEVSTIASGVGTALGVPVPPAALDEAIGGLVDGVTGLLNFFGVFKHKATA